MKTLDDVMSKLTEPAMLTDLADLIRMHDDKFPQVEDKYKAAVAALRHDIGDTITPTVDEYLTANETTVVANILYAAYLGYRANLENFHSPYTTGFVRMDFTDYIRDHLVGHSPASRAASSVIDTFYKALPEEYRQYEEDISEYFIALDVYGPKLAHYAGYIISNKFLPWVEPGYQEDYSQTLQYMNELKKYMGFLPV